MKNKNDVDLVVISGPSGVGKGVIIKQLLDQCSFLHLAVSATTRSSRKHEVEGIDYYFLSDQAFDKSIKQDDFVEWCQVHKHRYGTLKNEFSRIKALNGISLLEIDVVGALKIKQLYPQALIVFIAPPNLTELKKRLQIRNTESDKDVAIRLKTAEKELLKINSFDFLLINDIISNSINELNLLIKNSYNRWGV